MSRTDKWEDCPVPECTGGIECKNMHGRSKSCDTCACNVCTHGICWTTKEDVAEYLAKRGFELLGFPGDVEIYRLENVIVKVEKR